MRECLVCKKDIGHRSHRAKYCSDECKAEPIFRGAHCLNCNGPIFVRSSGQSSIKYCSVKCSKIHPFNKMNPAFNENYFAEPNLENSYWAGFIAADGYINDEPNRQRRLCVTLKSTDDEQLHNLKSSLGGGAVRYYSDLDKRTGNRHYKVAFSVTSEKICADLEKVFNIFARKSLTHEPPSLTGDLAYAFIAGYIDGDGSYSHGSNRPVLAIAGTKKLLTWISQTCGFDKRPRRHGEIYTIHYYGDDAINIRSLFESFNLPFLKRKKNRWESLGLNLKLLRGAR